jgi:CheY-like chemotaxis protein
MDCSLRLVRLAWRAIVSHCILVVDDDLDIRELMTELLNERGFPAACVADGQEALAYLAAPGRQVCLILLDLMMPVMSGWELAEILQKDPVYSQIPLVIISADRDATTHGAALGARASLQKPIELEALLGVARQYC